MNDAGPGWLQEPTGVRSTVTGWRYSSRRHRLRPPSSNSSTCRPACPSTPAEGGPLASLRARLQRERPEIPASWPTRCCLPPRHCHFCANVRAKTPLHARASFLTSTMLEEPRQERAREQQGRNVLDSAGGAINKRQGLTPIPCHSGEGGLDSGVGVRLQGRFQRLPKAFVHSAQVVRLRLESL